MPGDLTLILDRGDVPSLAALGLERDRESLLIWHMRETDAAAPVRLEICRRHAAFCGSGEALIATPGECGLPDLAPPIDLHRTQLLVASISAGVELGCSRVVWPVQLQTPEEMLREAERAQLVKALACLSGSRRIDIELPVFDLDDHQIVELAADSGLPLDHFWPCAKPSGPCGGCPGCRRWQAAFERADVDWPWSLAAVAASA